MGRLDEFVARRNHLAERYLAAFADLPLTLPRQNPDCYSAYHLFVVRLDLERLEKGRRRIFEELREQGILVNVHYIPIHRQPYYERLGFKAGDFPAAEAYYREALTLPLYFLLSYQEQDRVIAAVREALS
jgi:dTDP-4-amino-4,6-dideoxygalactose transaminase